jgi:hypothetical protein
MWHTIGNIIVSICHDNVTIGPSAVAQVDRTRHNTLPVSEVFGAL